MSAEHSHKESKQMPDSEPVQHLKSQLKTAWKELPDEHKAAMALELMKDLMEGEDRLTFRETIDRQWPVRSESVHATFALLTITHDDLRQIGLDDEQASLIGDDKLSEMSEDIRDHYVVQGFWEELKYHITHVLDEENGSVKYD